METVQELLTSIKTYLSERLSNPLYGAFVVSWLILNFRLVLILIGEGTWVEKIRFIDTRLYLEWWHWALYGYLLPLIAALSYLFLSPFLNRWIAIFFRVTEKTTKLKLLDIDGEVPLTREEADQLRQKIFEEINARRIERKKLQSENQELQTQIGLLVEENATLKEKLGLSRPDKDKVTLNLPQNVVEALKGPRADRLPLFLDDFVGVAPNLVSSIVARGLTKLQGALLYLLRDGYQMDSGYLRSKIKDLDMHSMKVALDQLEALELIKSGVDEDENANVWITPFGSQALEGLITRGFRANEIYPELT